MAIAAKGENISLWLNWNAQLLYFTMEKSVSDEVRETLSELKMMEQLPQKLKHICG